MEPSLPALGHAGAAATVMCGGNAPPRAGEKLAEGSVLGSGGRRWAPASRCTTLPANLNLTPVCPQREKFSDRWCCKYLNPGRRWVWERGEMTSSQKRRKTSSSEEAQAQHPLPHHGAGGPLLHPPPWYGGETSRRTAISRLGSITPLFSQEHQRNHPLRGSKRSAPPTRGRLSTVSPGGAGSHVTRAPSLAVFSPSTTPLPDK